MFLSVYPGSLGESASVLTASPPLWQRRQRREHIFPSPRVSRLHVFSMREGEGRSRAAATSIPPLLGFFTRFLSPSPLFGRRAVTLPVFGVSISLRFPPFPLLQSILIIILSTFVFFTITTKSIFFGYLSLCVSTSKRFVRQCPRC